MSGIQAAEPAQGHVVVTNPIARNDSSTASVHAQLMEMESQHTRWRRGRTVAVFAALVVLLVVGVVLILVFADSGNARSFVAPSTFSATYAARSRVNATSVVTGSMHKQRLADGTWVVEGTASVVSLGDQRTTVTLVGGSAYVEVQRVGSGAIVEQRCLGDAAMPLVVELGAAVDQSSEVNVESLTTDVSGCHGADVFAFSFMGLSYLLCMNSAEDTAQVLGNTFVATLHDVDTSPGPSPFTVPINTSSARPMECPQLSGSALTASQQRRLSQVNQVLTGSCYDFPPCAPLATERRLYPSPAAVRSERRASTQLPWQPVPRRLKKSDTWFTAEHLGGSSQVVCAFLHGAGVQKFDVFSYWGDLEHLAFQCKSYVFLDVNTAKKSWTDSSVSTAVCDMMQAALATPDSTYVATFTHGSANLMLAQASTVCPSTFDWQRIRWMELQASYPVGRLVEFGTHFCDIVLFYGWGDALQRDFGLCDNSHLAAGWADLAYTAPAITQALADIVIEHVEGAMCGGFPSGLLGSVYSQVVDVAWADSGTVAGAVAWSNCWRSTPERQWLHDPDSAWYEASVNYVDVTCRNGDGFFANERLPCSWIGSRVNRISSLT